MSDTKQLTKEELEMDEIDQAIGVHEAMLKHHEKTLVKTIKQIEYRRGEIHKWSLKRTIALNLKLPLNEASPAEPIPAPPVVPPVAA